MLAIEAQAHRTASELASSLGIPFNPTSERAYRGGNAIHLMATGLQRGYEDADSGKIPEFVPSPDGQAGYVLFLRDSTLFAQPFDVRKLAMAGEAFQVASPVGSNPVGRREGDVGVLGFFSASANGVLMYRSGSSGEPQLTWLDRGGKLLGNVGEPGGYSEIDLSPDGKRVAAVRNGDIWIIELDRNVATRFTFDGAGNRAPVWSRDGTRIAFESNRNGPGSLYTKSASGASKDELLFKSAEEKTPTSWSLDGQSLLFTSIGKSAADIMLLPLAGDKQPKPLVQTEFQEGQGQVSPDGRWLAYISSTAPGCRRASTSQHPCLSRPPISHPRSEMAGHRLRFCRLQAKEP